MPEPLTIRVPLPPAECSPNARYSGNWRRKGKAVKGYRERVGWLARQYAFVDGLRSPFPRATITAVFYCGNGQTDLERIETKGLYRPLDSTNAAASLKAAVDGLVDAGVIAADDHRHLRMMPPVLLRTQKEHQRRAEVMLTITEWVDEVSG